MDTSVLRKNLLNIKTEHRDTYEWNDLMLKIELLDRLDKIDNSIKDVAKEFKEFFNKVINDYPG